MCTIKVPETPGRKDRGKTSPSSMLVSGRPLCCSGFLLLTDDILWLQTEIITCVCNILRWFMTKISYAR